VRGARTAAGALALMLAVLGCERPAEEPVRSAPPEEPPVILFVGTSLTAGYGVLPQDAFPALIEARLRETGAPHRVVAAGRSGETSAEALARMDRVLARRVDVLVLESGANDLLRGMDPNRTRRNLQAMVDAARRRHPGVEILLLGISAPEGLATPQARRFARIYPELARRNDLAVVPSLLEGVAGVPEHNLGDGIHPNAAGHRRMAVTVWEALRDLL
jgi:acyl-CoA thioesterase I